MNGIHDMGGMQGFGKVEPEPNEPVFHAEWEKRSLAISRALSYAKLWNIDMSRAKIETLPPHLYLTMAYYDKWLYRNELLLLERGLVGDDELKAGHSLRPGKPLPRKLTADDVPKALVRSPFARPAKTPAQFAVGARVRTKNMHPTTHTRLPRYARGRTGEIECVRGCHVFPDTVAIGEGENPQWLYTVVFSARELWGDEADPKLTVSIEAWEPYLDAA